MQEPKYISNLNFHLKSLEIIKIKAEILEDKSLFLNQEHTKEIVELSQTNAFKSDFKTNMF